MPTASRTCIRTGSRFTVFSDVLMEQRTTKDTREKVEVPAPAARVFWGDGLDWANLLPRPWAGVGWWNGYELGN